MYIVQCTSTGKRKTRKKKHSRWKILKKLLNMIEKIKFHALVNRYWKSNYSQIFIHFHFYVVNIIFFIQFEGFIWNQTSLLLLRTISFWEIFAQSNFPHFKFPFSIRKPHQTERKFKWIPKNLYLAWRDDLI